MAVNFPNSPALNDTFQVGNVVYQWDGSVWRRSRVADPVQPDYAANRIINSNMSVAGRGEGPYTTSGYTLDRWRMDFAGGTHTVTRQAFVLGDKLGSNQPRQYLRSVTATQTTAAHLAVVRQYIEYVHTYADETITVLGWARRSVAGDIAVEINQNFGTGGSPSATVFATPVTVSIGTGWTPFAATFTIPSIVGKTRGSGGDDFVDLVFWQSAGADWNARSNTLGLFNGTLELWGIHILSGTQGVNTISQYRERTHGEEIEACFRYYETGTLLLQSPVTGNTTNGIQYITRKRTAVTPTLGIGSNASFNTGGVAVQGLTISGFNVNGDATGSGGYVFINWTASAEL